VDRRKLPVHIHQEKKGGWTEGNYLSLYTRRRKEGGPKKNTCPCHVREGRREDRRKLPIPSLYTRKMKEGAPKIITCPFILRR
jgi:hypothetical protein